MTNPKKLNKEKIIKGWIFMYQNKYPQIETFTDSKKRLLTNLLVPDEFRKDFYPTKVEIKILK